MMGEEEEEVVTRKKKKKKGPQCIQQVKKKPNRID